MSVRHSHGSGRRGRGTGVRKPKALLTGTLRVVRPGLATVHTAEGDFVVARGGLREGMDGDEVRLSLARGHGSKERVAYVQGVVARARNEFLGSYEEADPLGVVLPLDGRITHDFFVLPQDQSARRLGVGQGDVVEARILEYPSRHAAGVVTIARRVGSAQELDLDMEAVIASHGLATSFPEVALREAESLSLDVDGALASDRRRRDLRSHVTVTIDPADARDFDDAVGARRTPDGFELEVHIADVSHYVRWNSSMDVEARQRGCSCYLADRVLPMLPERLCNGFCSLRPDEDRLAMSVFVSLDERGEPRATEACCSAVRSRARLSYDEVDALLEGRISADDLPAVRGDQVAIVESLGVLDQIARLRVERRRERGAIDFQTREAKVTLDQEGHPTGVRVRARTRATALVEEAMLLANEAVADRLSSGGIATAYRVHEQPTHEDLAAALPILRELGLVHAEEVAGLLAADPHSIQGVLDAARGTTAEVLANAVLLRAQRRAVYLPHNDGHYALGAPAYCHFTSPIRRYPDLVVHRSLKALLAGARAGRDVAQMECELPQICRSCSERERVADAAERDSQKVKMAQLFSDKVGQDFSGVVVGCERYGLFVMLDQSCAEGLLPVRELGDEWFSFDQELLTLTGEESGRVWRPGMRVAVTVTGAKPSRGQIDFALAGGGPRATEGR